MEDKANEEQAIGMLKRMSVLGVKTLSVLGVDMAGFEACVS
jgi:hypothetical protein